MYGLTLWVQSPLGSADGKVLFTDKASVLSRWSEHFQSLFNADCVVQEQAVLRTPQQPFKAELDELPSVKEITKAIEQLRSGKAVGVGGSPSELWKDRDQSNLPSDLRDTKNKGEKTDCYNYRRKHSCSCAPNQIGTHHRDRGAPKKRFKDSLKTLGTCHIDYHKWSTVRSDAVH